MPLHDWTLVEAGIFHDFHHEWISEIKRALNRGILPSDCDALAEQVAAGFGPDVLTFQDRSASPEAGSGPGTVTLARPSTKHFAQRPAGLRSRRKSLVAVRHVSDDRIVAMIEIVSPGNKDSGRSFRAFVEKAGELMDQGVHLLLLDPFPPGPRDPEGFHSAIWEDVTGEPFPLPNRQSRTFVSYESAESQRAWIETLAVGDRLPDMPLFLRPEYHVSVPLEATYSAAWETVPSRWRRVVDPTS